MGGDRPRKGFAAHEGGTVAVMTAIVGAILIVLAALTIDLGSVYLQSRKLQGVADLAAIAAARDLGNAATAARATIEANGWQDVNSTVTTGRYTADGDLAPSDRFAPGAANPNAARVELEAQAELLIGAVLLGKRSVTVRRKGTAARSEFASFSIGTRLAALDNGLVNALLSSLVGGKVSLSVMDYDALANAEVDLFAFTKTLRTNVGLGAVSFNDTLSADLTIPQALDTLVEVLTLQGDTRGAAAAAKLAVASKPLNASIGGLIDLGAIGEQSEVLSLNSTGLSVNAMDLAKAMLMVGREGRQLKLDVGAHLPGLTEVDVWLAVGERPNRSPWLAIDDKGQMTVRTNQARLYVEAKVLGLLGGLGLKPIRVPLLVELSSGEAKLKSITCPTGSSQSRVKLDVRPSLGKLTLGAVDTSKLNNFKQELKTGPATLVDIGLLAIHATAQTKLGGTEWQTVEFTQADIDKGRVKTVKTKDLLEGTLSTLLGKTKITVSLAGILTPTLDLAVLSALSVLGAPLDALVNTLTGLLGVGLGQADVQVHGVRCGEAVLVA